MRPRAGDCQGRHERFFWYQYLSIPPVPPSRFIPPPPRGYLHARHPRIRSQRHPLSTSPHRLFRFHHEPRVFPDPSLPRALAPSSSSAKEKFSASSSAFRVPPENPREERREAGSPVTRICAWARAAATRPRPPPSSRRRTATEGTRTPPPRRETVRAVLTTATTRGDARAIASANRATARGVRASRADPPPGTRRRLGWRLARRGRRGAGRRSTRRRGGSGAGARARRERRVRRGARRRARAAEMTEQSASGWIDLTEQGCCPIDAVPRAAQSDTR